MDFQHNRLPLLSTAAALFLSLGSAPVMATALFSAFADARLTITDISGGGAGLFIDSLTFDDPQDSAFGNAAATATSISMLDAVDPFDMQTGEGMSLMAAADGQADPSGSALADAFTDGEIFLDNQSGATVVVSFSLEFGIGADTSVMDVQSGFAFATASLEVFGEAMDASGGLLIDVFELVQSNSDFGGDSDALIDIVAFDVLLAPGASEILIASVNTFGLATASAVAEPATRGIALLGLALLAFMIRRSSAVMPASE